MLYTNCCGLSQTDIWHTINTVILTHLLKIVKTEGTMAVSRQTELWPDRQTELWP